MKDYILQVDNLVTHFHIGRRTVNAVNGVTFDLERGKTLGIVGESGCGKSITARSIMQLLPNTAKIEQGSIIYHRENGDAGIDLAKEKKNGKLMRSVRGEDISIIFQDPLSSLNPVYRVGDQIVENLTAHEKIDKKTAKQRAVDLLKELGIPQAEKRIDDYPHQFSGGMKQRVMIAIAMICEPKILIADEPTTALDVTIQAQILELMKKLQSTHGTSIIMITHNMGIVAQMCDEIAVMYMGRIVEKGTAEQVLTNPVHPYTKALLKSVPVLGMGQDKELFTIPGQTPDGSTVFEGCAFGERCAYCTEKCTKSKPAIVEVEPGHFAECHILHKEVIQ